jgi:hypothetical protein
MPLNTVQLQQEFTRLIDSAVNSAGGAVALASVVSDEHDAVAESTIRGMTTRDAAPRYPAFPILVRLCRRLPEPHRVALLQLLAGPALAVVPANDSDDAWKLESVVTGSLDERLNRAALRLMQDVLSVLQAARTAAEAKPVNWTDSGVVLIRCRQLVREIGLLMAERARRGV